MKFATLPLLITVLIVFAVGCSKEAANDAGTKMKQASEAVKDTSHAAKQAGAAASDATMEATSRAAEGAGDMASEAMESAKDAAGVGDVSGSAAAEVAAAAAGEDPTAALMDKAKEVAKGVVDEKAMRRWTLRPIKRRTC